MQFLAMALTSSVILVATSCKLQYHDQRSKEQGLGAAIGDSAKGLAKLLTEVSDDVAKAARKFSDEGKFDDLAAIMARGGKKADEAAKVFESMAASKKNKLDNAATTYFEMSKKKLIRAKRLEPYMNQVNAALDEFAIFLKRIDGVSDDLSEVSRDVLAKNVDSVNMFEFGRIRLRYVASDKLRDKHSFANQIAGKAFQLEALIKSIAGYDSSSVKQFEKNVYWAIHDRHNVHWVNNFANTADQAIYDPFASAIGNALVRRSLGNFAERNFQEIKNILTVAAKDKPQIIENVRTAVNRQKDRLSIMQKKYIEHTDMLYGMTSADKKQVLDFLDEIKP